MEEGEKTLAQASFEELSNSVQTKMAIDLGNRQVKLMQEAGIAADMREKLCSHFETCFSKKCDICLLWGHDPNHCWINSQMW